MSKDYCYYDNSLTEAFDMMINKNEIFEEEMSGLNLLENIF